MALPNPFTGLETKALEPVDQELMDLKIRENIEFLDTAIDALGGGGSGGGSDLREIYAEAEVVDDLGVTWDERHHPMQNISTDRNSNIEGFDIEGVSSNRFFWNDNTDNYSFGGVVNDYLGTLLSISKSGIHEFKSKKGENFFRVGFRSQAAASDNVEVRIDGVLATGLVDENGAVASSTFTTVSASTKYQDTMEFYGLDTDKEQVITLTNNDSGTDIFLFNFVEVGFMALNPTISETITISAGKAIVKGTEVSYDEGSHTFQSPIEGKGNGHEGALVIDTSGVITVLDGISGAQTQAKAEESISFSSPVTSIKVKNNYYFPDSGIALMTLPTGQYHLFSYAAKAEVDVANHTLDEIIFESQPTQDFIPLDGFTSTLAGNATGDVNINLYAKAPIIISAANNKIDISITVNGVTTSHTATIASGAYSADLVSITTAVVKALQAAKAIDGEYFLKYDSLSGKYSIGCNDITVTKLDFLFSTGASTANSVHSTLGFADVDLLLKTSYISTIEKRHLAQKVYASEKEFVPADSSKFKYNFTTDVVHAVTNDAINRLGFASYRGVSTNSGALMQFFPEDTSTGASFSFLKFDNSGMLSFQVNNGPITYLLNADSGTNTLDPSRSNIISTFLSWGQGTKKISIRYETSIQFEIDNNTNSFIFLGAREYFNAPAYQALTADKQILKTYAVASLPQYSTDYSGISGAIYSPDNGGAGKDQLNTVVETGSWGGANPTNAFNRTQRFTSTANDRIDINLTLQGQGSIKLKTFMASTRAKKVAIFVSSGAIVEGTDRINNVHCDYITAYYDQDSIGVDLPAGTWNVRFKSEHASQFEYNGFVVTDTVQPDSVSTHTDLTNNGQGLPYAANAFRYSPQQDSSINIPNYLERTGIREGIVSPINFALNAPTFTNLDDSGTLFLDSVLHYTSMRDNLNGATIKYRGFSRSMSSLFLAISGTSATILNDIDGVATANASNTLVCTKGGAVPTTHIAIATQFQKKFEIAAALSAGSTYLVSNTRGMRDKQRIRLYDGTSFEDFTMTNIVTNVSFDIEQTPAVIVPANVTLIDFSGFHNIEHTHNTSSGMRIDSLSYEPLPLFASTFKRRFSRRTKLDTKTINFKTVINGDDLYYPVHEDGVQGSWQTSSIDVTATNSTGMSWSFDNDLKNVTLSGSSMDIKITSTRVIFEGVNLRGRN